MINYDYYTYWSKEDEAWITRCHQLPSLMTHGSTPTRAMKEMEIAIEDF
jgi:predicted RNase H-like HicB family nuclease